MLVYYVVCLSVCLCDLEKSSIYRIDVVGFVQLAVALTTARTRTCMRCVRISTTRKVA